MKVGGVSHTVMNGSVWAGAASGLVDLDANSIVDMANIYYFGLTSGQTFDLNPAGLTASGLQATLPGVTVLTDFFLAGTDAYATSVAAGANTVGVSVASFAGWSWAHLAGELADFLFASKLKLLIRTRRL